MKYLWFLFILPLCASNDNKKKTGPIEIPLKETQKLTESQELASNLYYQITKDRRKNSKKEVRSKEFNDKFIQDNPQFHYKDEERDK